jgi:hypothetical protein
MTDQTAGRHIFISYRRQEPDLSFARQLVADLGEAGHKVWIDIEGIEGGTTWTDEIQRAVETCYAYVIIISPDSLESPWVRKELLYALNEKPGRVFPVLYRAVPKLPIELVDIQVTDFQSASSYPESLAKLLFVLPSPPLEPVEEPALERVADDPLPIPPPAASVEPPVMATPPQPKAPPGGFRPRGRVRAESLRRNKPFSAPLRSLDTRLDIIGVALIVGAVVFLLSALVGNPGLVMRSILRAIFQTFGWGAFPGAAGAVVAGVWLIRRHFGDRIGITARQVGGIGLSFAALLVLIHAVTVAIGPTSQHVYVNPAMNDPAYPGYTPELIWEEAVACPADPQVYLDQGWVAQSAYLDVYDLAQCGSGGGYVGALVVQAFNVLFGVVVTFVIAILALIGGILLATRTSLRDILRLFV